MEYHFWNLDNSIFYNDISKRFCFHPGCERKPSLFREQNFWSHSVDVVSLFNCLQGAAVDHLRRSYLNEWQYWVLEDFENNGKGLMSTQQFTAHFCCFCKRLMTESMGEEGGGGGAGVVRKTLLAE